jgi:hypothetical protein
MIVYIGMIRQVFNHVRSKLPTPLCHMSIWSPTLMLGPTYFANLSYRIAWSIVLKYACMKSHNNIHVRRLV